MNKKKDEKGIGEKEQDFSKKLEIISSSIEKKFGKESIRTLGEDKIVKCDSIDSGSVILNNALGIGGYPRGRIVEIYGHESSGKTTLALHAVAETQKKAGIAVFVDVEHALDPVYAKKIGVNPANLLLSQPDYGEQALEIVETAIRSGQSDIVIVDSVAALTPKSEIEGKMGDSPMAGQARLMSQALRKLNVIVAKSKTCLIFINQTRMKLGVMFGSPFITSGGNALKFYASIRLEINKSKTIKVNDEAVGIESKIKIVKNKLAAPFKVCEVEMKRGEGIDKYGELLDLCCQYNIIQKKGAWYLYNEQKLRQGRESVISLFKEKMDLFVNFSKKLQKVMV